MTGKAIATDYYGWVSRITAKVLPEWVASDGKDSVFMWPLPQLLASALHGLLPRDIWQTPHEDFDLVFSPNEFSRELLERSGYPMEKVKVYGPPRLDEALILTQSRSAREALYRDLGLKVDDPYILWNVEPSWEHSYCGEEEHWAWVSAVAEILAGTGLPIVVSLHPLCDPVNYAYLSDRYGFHMPSNYFIHHLYPGASFIVTFPCSTNQYASVFGKRLVLCDWFGATDSEERRPLYLMDDMVVATTIDALRATVAAEVSAKREIVPLGLSNRPLAATAMRRELEQLVATRLSACS